MANLAAEFRAFREVVGLVAAKCRQEQEKGRSNKENNQLFPLGLVGKIHPERQEGFSVFNLAEVIAVDHPADEDRAQAENQKEGRYDVGKDTQVWAFVRRRCVKCK